MNREQLIQEVKSEYAELASLEDRDHIVPASNEIPPNAYYEKLLGMVIDEIQAGKFDDFNSGTEIIEAVADDKNKWLPEWDLD